MVIVSNSLHVSREFEPHQRETLPYGRITDI